MKRVLLLLLIAACCILGDAKTRYSVLGDSYSTFEGYVTPDTNAVWYFTLDNIRRNTANDVSHVEDTWWYRVISQMDGELEVNNSFSGSTICNTGYNKRDFTDRSFITRSNKLGTPDVIMICGATNDDWAGAPLGEYVYGNWTAKELYCFRPAMAKLLHDIRANYPTARVLFILNSELRPDINDSVHTICNHYGIACLDLQDIDKQSSHPSVKGMHDIATQVTRFLRSR